MSTESRLKPETHPHRQWQSARLGERAARLLFGSDPSLHLSLRLGLAASLVYLLLIPTQWLAVAKIHVPVREAWLVTASLAGGALGFYFFIRLGGSRTLSDRALVKPQMAYALGALAQSYVVNWPARGSMLMIAALVLVYGAFNLAPRSCRAMGLWSVLMFGVAMAVGHLRSPEHFPFAVEIFHFGLAAMVLPVVALLSGQLSQLRLDRRRQKAELRDALERLRLVATRDELTGLPNRRYMQEWVTQEISRAGRTGNSTCLTLIDLDHFKQVNDRFGHAVGDAALRILAREARTVLREADLLARWGGEEFLLVMPDATPANALLALDRLRARFEDPLTWAECPQAQVRFSAGLTALRAGEVFEIAVRRADAALYDAKRAGRNCTVLATFEPTGPADALHVTGTATPEAAAP